MNQTALILICMTLSCNLQAGSFATGASEFSIPQQSASESNKEAYLTLGQTAHKNPQQSSLFGTAQYGYGYGQLELGRTYNVRGKNSGGFIINPDANSAFIGVEPFGGEFKFGSQVGSNRYAYNPGVSAGLQLNAFKGSVVPVLKIGPTVSNIYEPNSSSYQPTYGYHRTYGGYLNYPGIVSFGYTNTWLSKSDQNVHSSNFMLFKMLSLTYEDSLREKLYTVTLEL